MGVEVALIGLGNPGPRYAETRHNLGFRVVDRLLSRWAPRATPEAACRSLLYRCQIEGRPVLLAKPLTYMNRSGEAVLQIADRFSLPPDQLWVLVDDFQLPLGTLRIRKKGSDGGHNGLASITAALRTEAFPRFRMGIGQPPNKREVIAYVLGEFSPTEIPIVSRLLDWTADAVQTALKEGIEVAMSRFNGPVPERPPSPDAPE
ncbi:MAG: peptidyl-tRNA hydrolase [Candidatus Poribacteria bacterium]|nr:MAG: peptidyl-tRNA hydrolase [Candidatus Poribacteria bacterium]